MNDVGFRIVIPLNTNYFLSTNRQFGFTIFYNSCRAFSFV